MAVPPESRPRLLRGSSGSGTIALALLGESRSRRRRGLIRSRALHLNETGDPLFNSPMIEHNGILMAAGRESAVWEAFLAWFAARRNEADELLVNGSLLRLPEQAIEARGLMRNETSVPAYAVDLRRLAASDGKPHPVLSANARQQLRRAVRDYQREGPLRLDEAGTLEAALSFFAALKVLHCASWERRGRAHAFSGGFSSRFTGC